MKSLLLVVKIGGSILTPKDDEAYNEAFREKIKMWYLNKSPQSIDLVTEIRNTLQYATLQEFVKAIGVYREKIEKRELQLVIVHGAGTVGHATATQLPGEVVKHLMTIMNQEIVSALLHALPVVSVPSAAVSTAIQSKLVGAVAKDARPQYQQIVSMLENGLVPVMYGDMILSEQGKWCILSGDLLPILLQKYLTSPENTTQLTQVSEAIFVSKYPKEREGGLYTDNPIKKEAILIKRVQAKNDQLVFYDSENKVIPSEAIKALTSKSDKTEGIWGKVKEAAKLSQTYRVPCRLIGLHDLSKALEGTKLGTIISSEH